jgi:sulfotransferase
MYNKKDMKNKNNKNMIFLSGLPRSGSTLLCNLLSHNPQVISTPSSPLCPCIQQIRNGLCQDTFLLAQLDGDNDINKRIMNSSKAFMETWLFDNIDEEINTVIDKNRGWLFNCESIREMYPDFKMIVTLRDLRGVYSSIEKRHRKTLFLSFPDNMEHNNVIGRKNQLFDPNGIIGNIVAGLQNLMDIPDIMKHLYIWRYEDFIENPQKSMDHLFDFIDVDKIEIDFNNIKQYTNESDSYYRLKYPHKIKSKLKEPEPFYEGISPRILDMILNENEWFYKTYYPEKLLQENVKKIENQDGQEETIPINNIKDLNENIEKIKSKNSENSEDSEDSEDSDFAKELEDAIEREVGRK